MSFFQKLLNPPDIEKLKAEGDINGLIKLLGHNDAKVRQSAVQALVSIGVPTALSLVTALRSADDLVLLSAAEALGKIGTTSLEPLLSMLKNKNEPEKTRMTAALALGWLAAQAKDAALNARLVNELLAAFEITDVLRGIGEALYMIGGQATEALISVLKNVKDDSGVRSVPTNGAILILANCFGESAIWPLIELVKTGKDRDYAAALGSIALERIGSAAVWPLTGVLEQIGWNCLVCQRVADVLVKIGDMRAMSTLEEVSRNNEDQLCRKVAFDALRELKKKQSYSGPAIANLTQGGLLKELQNMGLPGHEAVEIVEEAIKWASVFSSEHIQAICSNNQPLTLPDLPIRWAAHCIQHGARPQRAKP